jgi:hypothetical protein
MPSAAILSLAREFAAIYERWKAKSNLDSKESALFDRLVFEAMGLAREDWPLGDPEFERTTTAIANESMHDPVDEHGCSIIWNEINDAIFPLCEKIVSLPARTIADLALQARAVALLNAEYWTGEEEGPQGFVTLVNSVCSLGGVEAMPGVEHEFADDGKAVQSWSRSNTLIGRPPVPGKHRNNRDAAWDALRHDGARHEQAQQPKSL